MKKVIAVMLLVAFSLTFCFSLVACTPTEKPEETCQHTWNDKGVCTKCGEANPDYQEPVVESKDLSSLLENPITITFYHTMGENLRNVLDPFIDEFEEMYPTITVEHKQVGGYDDVRDQIKTELNANKGPSLAYCYPDHVATYNVSGKVVTLDSYIYSNDYIMVNGEKQNIAMTQEQIDDFIPGYWNEGKQFGSSKMYTLPFSKSTEVLYYNETFFTENNIQVPTHWWCDESCPADCKTSMEYVCAQILTVDSTAIPLGYDSESNWFITMCEQLGSNYTAARGDNYLFNNPANRNFVKRFQEWYAKGWVTTQGLHGSYTSGLFTATTGSRSYMSIGSSAGATHQRPNKVTNADGTASYPFNVGIAAIPQVDVTNPKAMSQGPSICMFAKSESEQLATWLLMKYLTTNVEFQAEFALASGYIPVLQSLSDTSKADYVKDENGEYVLDNGEKVPNVYMSFQNKLAEADGGAGISTLSLKVALEQTNSYFTSPAFNGSSTARDKVGALLQKCLVMTGADIEAQIKTAFEAAIAECKSAAN